MHSQIMAVYNLNVWDILTICCNQKTGIPTKLIGLNIGSRNIKDLINDLKMAFA
jgi:cystathionine beta-lyase/cystathionine gamma-synthase